MANWDPYATGRAVYDGGWYKMSYQTAYNFFCYLHTIQRSGSEDYEGEPISVYNGYAEGSTLIETLTYQALNTDNRNALIGKKFLIFYKNAVVDRYEGSVVEQPRYKYFNPSALATTDDDFRIGFTIDDTWWDPTQMFTRFVDVTLYTPSGTVTETGYTGRYSLYNLGPSTFNWPQGDANPQYQYNFPVICEWVDENQGNGTFIDMKYTDPNTGNVLIQMPFDFTHIMFLRYKVDIDATLGFPEDAEGSDEKNVMYKMFENGILQTSLNAPERYIQCDWYLTEQYLYGLLNNYSLSADYWQGYELSASGTRIFAVWNIMPPIYGFPKASLPEDPSCMYIALVDNDPLYIYALPHDGDLPLGWQDVIDNYRKQVQVPGGPILMQSPVPTKRGIYGTDIEEMSEIYDLPCTVFFNGSGISRIVGGYMANFNVNGAGYIDYIEYYNLWNGLFGGHIESLVFTSSAAYIWMMSDITVITFALEAVCGICLSQVPITYKYYLEQISFFEIKGEILTFLPVPFRNRSEKRYEIRIFGDHGRTASVLAGTSPISWSEENTKFMFEPVRTQSGYIQLLEDKADSILNAILPERVNSRPVALYDVSANKYVWIGFIKPQTYETEVFAPKQILKLPIICPLYAARSVKFQPIFEDERDLSIAAVFAIVLYQIQQRHPIPFTQVVFDYADQFFTGDKPWMKARMNTDFFRRYNDQNMEEWEYSCSDVLENICSFFGLSCRISGSTVYLLALDDKEYTHSMAKIEMAELVMMGFSKSYTPNIQTVTMSSKSLFAGPFASTKNETSLTSAMSKLTVKCDTDEIGDSIEMWGKWVTKSVWDKILVDPDYKKTFNASAQGAKLSSELIENVLCDWRLRQDRGNNYSTTVPNCTGYDFWIPQARLGAIAAPVFQNYMKLQSLSRRRYFIQDAILSLTMSVKAYNSSGEEISSNGDYYIELEGFDADENHVTIKRTVSTFDGDIVSDPIVNRSLYDPEYQGVKLAKFSGLNEYFFGKFNIIVKSKDLVVPPTYIVVESLTLHIVPLLGGKEPQKEFSHKIYEYAAGGSKTISTALVATDIASFRNRVSPVNVYSQQMQDYNPSKHLAQRMADYHGQPRRAFSLHIKGDLADSGVTPLTYSDKDGKRYVTVAAATDVRTESYTLTLVELPQNE